MTTGDIKKPAGQADCRNARSAEALGILSPLTGAEICWRGGSHLGGKLPAPQAASRQEKAAGGLRAQSPPCNRKTQGCINNSRGRERTDGIKEPVNPCPEPVEPEELWIAGTAGKLSQSYQRQRPVPGTTLADGLEQGPGKLPGDLDGFRPPVASQRGTPAGTGTGAERPSSGTGVVRGFPPSLAQAVRGRRESLRREESILYPLAFGRNLLLGGQPADQVGCTFHERVEALKSHLKQLQESTTRHAGEVEQYRGITEQIKKDLAETSGLLSARRQELDNWMVAYQENSEGKTLEESLSEMTAQKSECSFRLRTHEENKRKIAGFQQELSERRAMSERWAKLNELAGSADGAKFRRIAQGYTLDVLLSYANVQLRQLSRRYRLERVPDTLALQVIDQDMCDEIRTVHSLSGGESFLVSLALALGLSSLSSNRMKVESLFIDEGFGSLDAETLRVAMDALESLRTQGRKIGVISHVQEMTERIPVQIRVNRAGNGRSYLEVI